MSSNTSVRSKKLKQLKDEAVSVRIYLASGIKLSGVIEDFDDVSILLADQMLILLENAASIAPDTSKDLRGNQ